MTQRKKLTDEQKQRIKNLTQNRAASFVEVFIRESLPLVVQLEYYEDLDETHFAIYSPYFDINESFPTHETLISYAEDLLNRQYCWLPQNNGWITSDEVYSFANGGVTRF